MNDTPVRRPHNFLAAVLPTLTALMLAMPASRVGAQETSTTPTTDVPAVDDDTVILSPFTVSAGDDSGYRATSTLAGTRLRSKLSDVAASVSVATRDFMQDINATDAQDLLLYTLGTEVSGQGGNFSGVSLGSEYADLEALSRLGSELPLRVRGLARADKARDYFITDIDFDGYNTERVDISRGPNSVLYGLGAPGGIVSATTIAPRWDGRRTSVEVQYGRFDSNRASLDHNEVLIPGKLALRLAAKYSHDGFLQEEAFVNDRRGFISGVYRPFEDTTIRANFEMGKQRSRKPQIRPPFDGFTWWWDIGRPIYDPSTGELTLTSDVRTVSPLASGARAAGSTGTEIVDSVVSNGGIMNWGAGVGIVYADPNSSTPGIQGYDVYGTENWDLRSRPDGAGGLADTVMLSLAYPVRYLRYLHRDEVGANFWQDGQLIDENIFDYRHHMIEGVNKAEFSRFDAFNIAFEQNLLGDKAGIELVYDKQHLDETAHQNYNWLTYLFVPDINVNLPNGDPNPNFGRPVLADVGWAPSNTSNREATRATAFYGFDLRETQGGGWLGRLLGQHTITGSYSRQESFSEGFAGRPMMTGLDYYASESVNENYSNISRNDRRTLVHVSYVGPSVLDLDSASQARVQPISAPQNPAGFSSIPILYYQAPAAGADTPNAWTTKDISVFGATERNKKLTANWHGQRSASKVDSAVFVWQGRLLDDAIIPTVGWRRDSFKSYNAGGAQFDPATGLMITDDRFYWTGPSVDRSVTSTNWGVVAHVPRSWTEDAPGRPTLSVFYNSSDNMQAGGQRVDIFGRNVDPSSGSTEEFGVSASLLDGKFSMRLAKFETSILLETAGTLGEALGKITRLPGWIDAANGSGLNTDKPEAVSAWNTWAGSAEGSAQIALLQNLQGQNLVSTSDVVSDGYELEATWNIRPNWRTTFNVAKVEATRSNSAREVADYIDSMSSLWFGAAGALEFDDNNNLRQVLDNYSSAELLAPVRLARSLDGTKTQELREWRFNLVTNYSFTQGRLKGFNFGGAIRWQDKVGIGYGFMRDADTGQDVVDVSQVRYGPSETYYDAWVGYRRRLSDRVDWTLQLNLKNLFVDDDLVPIATQPDGSVAVWRTPEPMLWTLTSRFEF